MAYKIYEFFDKYYELYKLYAKG